MNRLSCALLAIAAITIAGPIRGPRTGFVDTQGTHFALSGKPMFFAGSNAYYFPFANNQSDVELGLRAAKKAGLNVFRTWGFNDKNATYNPDGLPQYGAEGAGATDVVFQTWQNGKSTIKIEAFDKVVNAAAATDIKLIVALTNNWADYGGMDVYIVNLGGTYHDDFYKMTAIKNAYKRYVRTFVERYRSSTAIMAWELGNELRCGATDGRNLPRSPNGCTPETLTGWVDEMSTFIKSIDPFHLVTVGGEGQFNDPSSPDSFYNGSDGDDFAAQIALPNVDFGTFHTYPDWWSKTVQWANQWIIDHANAAKKAGKPVLHEEYGWLSPAARLADLGKVAPLNETRVAVLSQWQATSLWERMPDMYWQFGFDGYSTGPNDDDGFTIYLNDPEAQPLVYEHAAKVNALNRGRWW
ncbi:glycoside hydrolase family 5 protein [Zasmidium cellare ATCC 36951]|uniref:mannan endo-1,4-beta-mannosidase n=1 Tax=Zasmidium cellare ATCC 36951 TaxID=1080233 RepID=A0A6A6C896_ZASCE|nr:glycoside hydrolase family 5 protein [Zasmidium cellare ATCC 36951]KAF2163063.1 glycoside hydrolase family 5 protein [Zasmidium cellare ATCC 36951]